MFACCVNLRIIDLNITKLLACFSEIVRDDLKQVKSDIRNISNKLETLKSFETGDKGQFQESITPNSISVSIEK